MKKTIMHAVKLLILFLFITTFSCQVEDEEKVITDNTAKNEYVVKEYSFDQINKKAKFNASFKTVTKLSSIYQRTNDNGSPNPINFEIDSTTIKEIEAFGKTTYTMFVKNNETPITESFENFIVEVDDNTNNIKAYLIKYYPDSEIENNHEHNSFTFRGETEISEIDYNSDIFMPTYQSSECSWSLKCDYGGSEHSAGANCTQTYPVLNCGSGGGGGSSTGSGGTGGNTGTGGSVGTTGSGGWGSGSGGGGVGSSGSNTNNNNTTTTTTSSNTGVVTATTLPENYIDSSAQIKRVKNLNASLSFTQNAYLSNNPAVKTDIVNYLESQVVNLLDITYPVEALEFVNELINDAINFPQVEGEDGGDEYNEDDYDNLVTQTQTLPNKNDFYDAFPKVGAAGMPSDQVYQLVGGSLYTNHNSTNEEIRKNYQNACAIRVSRALNYTNRPIPVFYNDQGQQRTEKGSDNKNYILDATSLLAYMKKTFPNTTPTHLVDKTPTQIKTALNGKWGIYIMIPKNRATFGASGHADFWSFSGCLSGCYFDQAKEVYFWQL